MSQIPCYRQAGLPTGRQAGYATLRHGGQALYKRGINMTNFISALYFNLYLIFTKGCLNWCVEYCYSSCADPHPPEGA
jgi:hypothetical protein